MKIKTTIKNMYDLYTSPLMRKIVTFNYPDIYSAYKVHRFAKKFMDYAKDIERTYNELIKKYGEEILDKDGKKTGQIGIDAANKEKFEPFTKEKNDFFLKEGEFEFENLIDLNDLKELKLNVIEMNLLDPFLDKGKIERHLCEKPKKLN